MTGVCVCVYIYICLGNLGSGLSGFLSFLQGDCILRPENKDNCRFWANGCFGWAPGCLAWAWAGSLWTLLGLPGRFARPMVALAGPWGPCLGNLAGPLGAWDLDLRSEGSPS